MRVIIIAGGSFSPCIKFKEDDYIICADSGYDNAKKFGIVPNLLIGDMDSVARDISDADEKIVFPVRKDYTDSEIAVRHAIEMKPEEIILLGSVGTRLDHSIGNILLLKQIHIAGIKGCLADTHNRVYYYKDSFEVQNMQGSTISLIPLSEKIEGISTFGLDYPLNNETLHFSHTRGISNVVLEIKAGYRSKKGEGLVCISSDEELKD